MSDLKIDPADIPYINIIESYDKALAECVALKDEVKHLRDLFKTAAMEVKAFIADRERMCEQQNGLAKQITVIQDERDALKAANGELVDALTSVLCEHGCACQLCQDSRVALVKGRPWVGR